MVRADFYTTAQWILSRNAPPSFLPSVELNHLHLAHTREATERTFSMITRRVDYASKNIDEIARFGPYLCTYFVELASCGLKSSRAFAESIMFVNRSVFNVDINPAINFNDFYGIGHTSSIVIGGSSSIGPGVFLNHGVTVGRFGDDRPSIGANVILMPHSAVLGRCNIGANSIISAGIKLINLDIPDNSLVFRDNKNGKISFKTTAKNYWRQYFCA